MFDEVDAGGCGLTASIFTMGLHINAPVIMMAEKAADLIRNSPPPAPADLSAPAAGHA